MNFIKYGDYNFHGDSDKYGKDGLFMSGDAEQRVALFGNELSADSLTFVVNSRALQGDGTGYAFLLDAAERPIKTSEGKFLVVKQVFPDYRDFTAGTPLDLYNEPNGKIIGRFYVENVTQISRKTVKFTCTDCIGVLSKMSDYVGGIWGRDDVKFVRDVIDEIMAGSGIEYTVSSNVGGERVIGRIPRGNRRECLGQLLVAVGASVFEHKGRMVVGYLGADVPSTVAQSDIYLNGGAVSQQAPATKVQVTEHAFYKYVDDEVVTLFDNTDDGIAAVNQLVVFDRPCHDLASTGSITIAESNANYAIISGVGTLTGKAYTHTTRVIERDTGVNAAEKTVALENNELVGIHNSAAVAQRMVKYYKLPLSINYEQLDEEGTLAAGTQVSITDPFGVSRQGWIRSKAFPIGNKTKAKMDVLVDWEGGPYGGSYSTYREFRQTDITNGVLSIPAEMQGKDALVFLIGGAGGGEGGRDGENGHNYTGPLTNVTGRGEPVMGGLGGAPGFPGKLPYVYSFQVPSLPASFNGAVVGAGGYGGTEGGAEGQEGAHTTLGGYSSADGERAIGEIQNLIDGRRYCLENTMGYGGGNGGVGSGFGNTGQGTSTRGGDARSGRGGSFSNGRQWTLGAPYRVYASAGAGGGGAAFRADGYDGLSGLYGTTNYEAVGGDGADAKPHYELRAAETQAGRGGNGGGGGGGATAGSWNEQGGTIYYDRGTGGRGGRGSFGQDGGNGLIIIYYNA